MIHASAPIQSSARAPSYLVIVLANKKLPPCELNYDKRAEFALREATCGSRISARRVRIAVDVIWRGVALPPDVSLVCSAPNSHQSID